MWTGLLEKGVGVEGDPFHQCLHNRVYESGGLTREER